MNHQTRDARPATGRTLFSFGPPRLCHNAGMKELFLLEQQLDAFDPKVRQAALQELCVRAAHDLPAAGRNVNMHLHSFFSYNALGYSPSHLAWEARKQGLYAAGLCDFDVLDGLEEFLAAGRLLPLRCTVSLETRAFLQEYAEVDISSPGEPGVTYIMGMGFAQCPPERSPAGQELHAYRQGAQQRNQDLLDRINARLPDIAITYQEHVLPLVPSATATERHIVTAYINRAQQVFHEPQDLSAFWGETLHRAPSDLHELMADRPRFEETVRAGLVKQGGIGYRQPSAKTFPPVDAFVRWVLACHALPTVTWLDGTSPGEENPEALLDCLEAKGCTALNIIPDRNWNVKDPNMQAVKTANLEAMVHAAVQRAFPVLIGTEMNKLGLPFVDDLNGPVLSRYRKPFVDGARILTGHTLLARYADGAYTGKKAAEAYPSRTERNRVFAAIGAAAPLMETDAQELRACGPEQAWNRLHDRAQRTSA